VHRLPLRRGRPLLLLFRLHEFHSRPTAVPPGKCHPLLHKFQSHYLVVSIMGPCPHPGRLSRVRKLLPMDEGRGCSRRRSRAGCRGGHRT
jgi:hypothetical protein